MSELLLKIASQQIAEKREPIDWESSGTKRGKPKWEQLEKKGGFPLEILGVPYGGQYEGRDADGQAFYKETDIVLNPGDIVPLTYYHGFGPDDPFKVQNPPEIIGLAKFRGETKKGRVFDALVDLNTELGLRIREKAREGADIKASSGTVSHLARFGKGGLIEFWPVAELAVFDTNEWRKPANDFATVTAKGNYHETEALGGAEDASLEGNKVENKKSKSQIGEMKMEKKNAPETEGQEVTVNVDAMKSAISEMIQEAFQANLGSRLDAVEEVIESFKAGMPENEGGAALDGKAPAYVRAENLGDVDPKEAYLHYMRTGEFLKGAKAALQYGAAAEGGILVPDDELRTIIRKRDERSIPRVMGATTFTTAREKFNVPVEDSSLGKFSIVAEEGAISGAEEEPTFAQVSIDIYKFMKLIKVSEELLEDDNAGLEEFLSDCIGRALADTENYYSLIGTGSSQPQGAFVGGTAALTLDSNSDIGATEIPELKYKLAQPYRDDSSCWVMKEDTEAVLRSKTGDPFTFAPSPRGTGDRRLETMVGYPVFANSNVAGIGGSAKSLLFANWRYYAIVTNRGLRIRRLNELYAGNGQVGILAQVRFGGAVLLAEAFQYATHPA